MPCPWFSGAVEGKLVVIRPHTNTCAIIKSRCLMDEWGKHPDYADCILEGCGRALELSQMTRMLRPHDPLPPAA